MTLDKTENAKGRHPKVALFVLDTLEMGGTEKSILEITTRFSALRPVVLHLFRGDALKGEFTKWGVEVISLNLSSRFSFFRCVLAVRRAIKTIDPDVVISSLFFSDFYTRLAGIGLGKALVGTFVSQPYGSARLKLLPRFTRVKVRAYQVLDMITAVRCRHFLANSAAIADANARALFLPRNKVSVIYRGRDTGRFPVQHTRNSGTCDFVSVGRLIERKGHLELIRAFKGIADRYPHARLRLAGEGYFSATLVREVALLGLENQVTFLGLVDNIPELLYSADFFVFPSHYEGFSGAVVEAMMAGIPVLASDIPMTREAIVHLEDGFLFEAGSERHLAEGMAYFIGNRAKAVDMGRRAREKAFKLYDIRNIARQTEQFLLQLMKGS